MRASRIKPTCIKPRNHFYHHRFDAFAARAFRIAEPYAPYQWNWHIDCIAEHLEAVYRGDIPRLIINLPPRSLKSYLVSAAYPAWVLGKDPSHRFINTGYSLEVVEANALRCRRLLQHPWYRDCFPAVAFAPKLNRKTHFETDRGGQYYATTALSSITGIGCDTMIIDDPMKPMEAFSQSVRDHTNQNIRATLLNRFNNPRQARFIMVMQRIHEQDPTGHLLQDGDYVHIKLPAEASRSVQIRLAEKSWQMESGDLLFPARLSRQVLDRLRHDLTETHYVGQYLQEPVPVGGGEFNPQWVNYYGEAGLKVGAMNLAILVDPAGGEAINRKKKKTSDWTAMLVVGLAADRNYYVLDMVRDRLNPTERIDTLFMLHRKWNDAAGKPARVGYEKYGMMTDTHYIRDRQRVDGYHFPLIPLGGAMMKEERIRRLIPDLQHGRWYFPPQLLYRDHAGQCLDLVRELVACEMASFPRARFDDMLDALSRIYEPELGLKFPAAPGKTLYPRSSTLWQPQEEESWMQF